MSRRGWVSGSLLIAGGAIGRDMLSWAVSGIADALWAGKPQSATWSLFPWENALGATCIVAAAIIGFWPSLTRLFQGRPQNVAPYDDTSLKSEIEEIKGQYDSITARLEKMDSIVESVLQNANDESRRLNEVMPAATIINKRVQRLRLRSYDKQLEHLSNIQQGKVPCPRGMGDVVMKMIGDLGHICALPEGKRELMPDLFKRIRADVERDAQYVLPTEAATKHRREQATRMKVIEHLQGIVGRETNNLGSDAHERAIFGEPNEPKP